MIGCSEKRTYSYDGDGQRTARTPSSGLASTYTYNAAGELASITGATNATYAYNGDGLRSSKTVGSTTTTFTYDTLGTAPLLLSDGTTDYIYGPGARPIEQLGVNGTNPTYYFSDVHGSTVELTNSSGIVSGSYVYSAWGAVVSHTGTANTPLEFAGAYVDSESGFLYLSARYFDPTTALFITIDPIVALTKAAYLYVDNNPLNAVDPLGLWDWGLTFGIAAAVVGLVAIGVATAGVGDVVILGGAGVAAAATETGVGVAAATEAGCAALTLGTALDASATGLGAAGAAVDCSKHPDSAQCTLDIVSVGTGLGGVGADILREPDWISSAFGATSAGTGIGSITWPEDGDAAREDRRRDEFDC